MKKSIMETFNKSIHYQRRRKPQAPKQFEELEASMLFCPKCKEAVPVRSKLLIVLPDGDKYDYLCIKCGSPIGSKVTKEETPLKSL